MSRRVQVSGSRGLAVSMRPLLSTVSAIALVAAVSFATADGARAEECITDVAATTGNAAGPGSHNHSISSGTDGASSIGAGSFACGPGAQAVGQGTTAIGDNAQAGLDGIIVDVNSPFTTVVGNNATAIGITNGTVVGQDANITAVVGSANNGTVIGQGANINALGGNANNGTVTGQGASINAVVGGRCQQWQRVRSRSEHYGRSWPSCKQRQRFRRLRQHSEQQRRQRVRSGLVNHAE